MLSALNQRRPGTLAEYRTQHKMFPCKQTGINLPADGSSKLDSPTRESSLRSARVPTRILSVSSDRIASNISGILSSCTKSSVQA
eukprot:8564017-Pyramimonas_sp.AAC.2